MFFFYSISIFAQKSSKSMDNAVIRDNNLFAFEMFFKLSAQRHNLFFSPYSLSSALAMLYAGAEGKTKQQFQKVLHYRYNADTMNRIFQRLNSEFRRRCFDTAQIILSNAFWAQDSIRFNNSYRMMLKNFHNTEIRPIDFKQSPENSRKTINSWIEESSFGKIFELLPPKYLTDYTQLVLTNAIYFHSKWSISFNESRTKEAPFYLSDGKKTVSEYISQTGYYKYNENNTEKFIEIPFQGDSISMLIILPKTADGLSKIEKDFSMENYDFWNISLYSQLVEISIPKFMITSTFSMLKTLQSCGLNAPFENNADFKPLSDSYKVHLSDMMHGAYVEVKEAGFKPALTVSVDLKNENSDYFTFNANRPFLFVIKDNATQAILFMGCIKTPEEN